MSFWKKVYALFTDGTSNYWGFAATGMPVYVEVDPQVGPNTDNYLPRWDADYNNEGGKKGALVTGRIYDNPSKPGIGIEIPDPETKLHMKASANDGINIDTDGWGANAFARIFFREGGSPDYGGVIGYDPALDLFRLTTMENGTEKYGLSIKRASGNVGVNTWDPQDKLDVNGNAIIRGTLYLGTPGDYRIQALVPNVSTQPQLVLNSLQFNPAKSVLIPPRGGFMVADSGNNHYNLHVIDASGDLYTWGSLHTWDVIYHGSDDRMKLEQEPLNYGLVQVMALQPKRYFIAEVVKDIETGDIHVNRNRGTNGFGFVAQDVYEVM